MGVNENPKNPLGALSRLQARLAEKAKEKGLQLVSFMVIPSHKPDGNHTAQAVFLPTEIPPEDADDETKAMLEGIEEATRAEEQAAKADAAREDLIALSDETTPDTSPERPMGPRSRGIGLDDP